MFWLDATTKYPCLVIQGPVGALCGYVAVDPSHPWHGIEYSQCPLSCGEDWCAHRPQSRLEVHGGITYSGETPRPLDDVPPDLREKAWWFGFTAAHWGDAVPGLHRFGMDGTYRDHAYMQAECEKIATQLSDIVA